MAHSNASEKKNTRTERTCRSEAFAGRTMSAGRLTTACGHDRTMAGRIDRFTDEPTSRRKFWRQSFLDISPSGAVNSRNVSETLEGLELSAFYNFFGGE